MTCVECGKEVKRGCVRCPYCGAWIYDPDPEW